MAGNVGSFSKWSSGISPSLFFFKTMFSFPSLIFTEPDANSLPASGRDKFLAFSGRSDLTATLVGSFVLLFGFQTITIYSQQAALVLMGALLLATVMVMPQGFIFGIAQLASDWRKRRMWSGKSHGSERDGLDHVAH